MFLSTIDIQNIKQGTTFELTKEASFFVNFEAKNLNLRKKQAFLSIWYIFFVNPRLK
jgi:hypothetical protein